MLPVVALLLATQTTPKVDEKAIDAYLTNVVKLQNPPGVSVAVYRDGKVVYAKGFGYIDVENKLKASPENVFRIGSLTKQFTATIVMQLIGEGKLKLTDTIADLLPDQPKSWDKVTVKQLLNHTSGIKSYTGLPNFIEFIRNPVTPKGIVKTVENEPFDFEPGSDWHYNNTGYEILGLMIEKLDGISFGKSLQTRILKPLRMDHTYFTSESTIVPNRARGYTRDGSELKNAMYLNMDWPYAAGSMESSVLDLAKWDAALYTDKVLPQSALDQMWTPTKTSDGKTHPYGFGWEINETNGVKIVEHSGGIPGFTTHIRRAPSHHLTVVALTNSDSADATQIASTVMGLADPALKVKEPVADPDNDLKATTDAKSILANILKGKIDRDRMTPECSAAIPDEAIQKISADISRFGEMSEFEFVKETKLQGAVTRAYRFKLGTTKLLFNLTMTDDGKIAGLNVHT